MRSRLRNRIKSLENLTKPGEISLVFIDMLENGEYEIYANINGEKRVFTDEEWAKYEENRTLKETPVLIDDVPYVD